jgi:hypothetical protein
MSFVLHPALPSDADVLIRNCDFPAMFDNPLRRLMFPCFNSYVDETSWEEEILWDIEGLRASLESQEMKFCKVCTDDGTPVGFAGWTPPVGDPVKSADVMSGHSEDVNDKQKDKENRKNAQRRSKGNELPKSLDIGAWLAASKKFKAEKDRVLQGRKNMWRKFPLPPFIPRQGITNSSYSFAQAFSNSYSSAGLNLISVNPAYQRKGAGSMLMEWGCGQADKTGSDTFLLASPAGLKLYEKFQFEAVGVVEIKGTKFTSMLRKARCQCDRDIQSS